LHVTFAELKFAVAHFFDIIECGVFTCKL